MRLFELMIEDEMADVFVVLRQPQLHIILAGVPEEAILYTVEVGGLEYTSCVVGPSHVAVPQASLSMLQPRQFDFDSFLVLLCPLAKLRIFIDHWMARASERHESADLVNIDRTHLSPHVELLLVAPAGRAVRVHRLGLEKGHQM